jgi:hypothetical protein
VTIANFELAPIDVGVVLERRSGMGKLNAFAKLGNDMSGSQLEPQSAPFTSADWSVIWTDEYVTCICNEQTCRDR